MYNKDSQSANKKHMILFLITLIICIAATVYFFITLYHYIKTKGISKLEDNSSITSGLFDDNAFISDSSDNSTVINVDADSSIRIIKSYDKGMFTGKKSIIFFWASWCSRCEGEINLIKNIISNPSNNDYNIFLVSHDYDIDELSSYIETNNINYDVWFDETRVIRKSLDPLADSVPLTYFLDENGNLLYSHNGAIDLETLNNLISIYMKK